MDLAQARSVIRVHGDSSSGNCHKVRLLLEQLGHRYEWVETDSVRGDTQAASFLRLNPLGKVPVIEAEDGAVLVESGAILFWLAEGTRFLPTDRWQRAQALRWMFFEQSSHEPCVAVARAICRWSEPQSIRRANLPALRARAAEALRAMDEHLQWNAWFSGPAYGIADIALSAYTSVADEGGISLEPWPAVREWLARVAGTPAFVPMPVATPASRATPLPST